jgi:hypothetical protein
MREEVQCPICEGRGAREGVAGERTPCRVCWGEGRVETEELALRVLSLTQALDHAVSTLLSEETPRQQILAELQSLIAQARTRATRAAGQGCDRLVIAYDADDAARATVPLTAAAP